MKNKRFILGITLIISGVVLAGANLIGYSCYNIACSINIHNANYFINGSTVESSLVFAWIILLLGFGISILGIILCVLSLKKHENEIN